MILLTVLAIVGIIWIAIGIVAIIFKKNEETFYNNGECPECGHPLYYKGIDFYGGRLYECDICGYNVSVTYSSTDKYD